MYPHNILLNFWVELGIAGMLLFIWIIGKYFWWGFKILKNKLSLENKYLVLGLIGAMTVIVVHGLVDVPYFKNDLSCLFWILIAMLSLLKLQLIRNK
jgi:O-antigen ligase